MVEYGGAVRQSGDLAGGGGSFDIVGEVSHALSDLVDRIASLPPEMLVLIVAIMLAGGLVFMRRPTPD